MSELILSLKRWSFMVMMVKKEKDLGFCASIEHANIWLVNLINGDIKVFV